MSLANVIDPQGYRLNIGIIVINQDNKVLWAKRKGQNAWQFPQGGVQQGERLTQALYRELFEELGLKSEDVAIEQVTEGFLKYRLPPGLIRQDARPLCIGQKQKWYLLRMKASDSAVNLEQAAKPEFEQWMWVPYWYPLRYVISFKKDVYRKALLYFAKELFGNDAPPLDSFSVTPRHSKNSSSLSGSC